MERGDGKDGTDGKDGEDAGNSSTLARARMYTHTVYSMVYLLHLTAQHTALHRLLNIHHIQRHTLYGCTQVLKYMVGQVRLFSSPPFSPSLLILFPRTGTSPCPGTPPPSP